MKRIAALIFVLIAALCCAMSAAAEDGVFTCNSNIEDFNGKTFENLSINLDHCGSFPNKTIDPYGAYVVFENITVTGKVSYEKGYDGQYNHYVNFYNSDLNIVDFACASAHSCEIGLNKGTTIRELNLTPSGMAKGKITVNGFINNDLKSYKAGSLVEDVKYPELFENHMLMVYPNSKIYDIPLEKTSDGQYYQHEANVLAHAYVDVACIEKINYYAEANAAIQLENVWVNSLFIIQNKANVHPTILTDSRVVVALLDSGSDFTMRKARWNDPTSFPCFTADECYYYPGMTDSHVLSMILHSDKNLTAYFDAVRVYYLLFFGNGAENSTLHLEQFETMYEMPYYRSINAYGANVEVVGGVNTNLFFFEKHNDVDYSNFYEILSSLEKEILESKKGELPRETDSDMFFESRYFDKQYFPRHINFWKTEYFACLPYGYAEESHGQEDNIPYVFLKGATVDNLYVSKNYKASNLPAYYSDNNITEKSFVVESTDGSYTLGTKGECQFGIQNYYVIDTFVEKEFTLLWTCSQQGGCKKK